MPDSMLNSSRKRIEEGRDVKQTGAIRAKGRALQEFLPLLPAEALLLDAARAGEMAAIGGERPEGFLAIRAGNTPPGAGWRRLPRPKAAAEPLWFARLTLTRIAEPGAFASPDQNLIRLAPARNRRGWRIPAAARREILSAADAAAETASLRIRPGFLRFLALGGDETAPVHEKGAQLRGAWIDGALDCEGCRLETSLFLSKCAISGRLDFRGARTRTINLAGTRVQGIRGDRSEVEGGLFVSYGFHSAGEVKLVSAFIARNLDGSEGWFENPGASALTCDGARIGGSLTLGSGFRASGSVRLLGVAIGRNLDCSGGAFISPGGRALLCVSAEIRGALILRGSTKFAGSTSFVTSHVNSLVDELPCWPENLSLDGFRYDNIAGRGFTDPASRIAWLGLQHDDHLGGDFKTQPWEHLITTLREMGHFEEAKEIAIEKQRRLRAAGKITGAHRALHRIFGALTAYGYRPVRLVKISLGIWLACALFFHYAASQGAFGPSNPLVFDNPKYEHCRPDAPDVSAIGKMKVGNWWWCPEAPGEYATFSPLAYSLNVMLPVVNLGQANEWGPITPSSPPNAGERGWIGNLAADAGRMLDPSQWEWRREGADSAAWRGFIGFLARFIVWCENLFGWAASLLLVAVLSGLAKKDDA